MNNLGVLYHEGLGVESDRDAALGWFRRAAEAGSGVAAENLRALSAD
jgi:TPR repeat protein